MPTFRRAAISFSAPATSSACARLSSWHGPAMIEIGRSLPNLTDPAATTDAAEVFAFKALSFFRRDHAGRRRPDQPRARIRKNGYRFCDQNTRKLSMRSRISGLRHGRYPAAPQGVRHGAATQFRPADAMLRLVQ